MVKLKQAIRLSNAHLVGRSDISRTVAVQMIVIVQSTKPRDMHRRNNSHIRFNSNRLPDFIIQCIACGKPHSEHSVNELCSVFLVRVHRNHIIGCPRTRNPVQKWFMSDMVRCARAHGMSFHLITVLTALHRCDGRRSNSSASQSACCSSSQSHRTHVRISYAANTQLIPFYA